MARVFLAPFGVALAALVGLFVVSEILTHLPEFIRHGNGFLSTLGRIGVIYANHAPYYVGFVAPMAMVIGAAFGLSDLSKHNELVAMKASGVSLMRALSPIFVTAALLSLLLVLNREYVVPGAESTAMRLFHEAIGQTDYAPQCQGVVREPTSQIVDLTGLDPNSGAPWKPWTLTGADPVYHAGYNFVKGQLTNLMVGLLLPDNRAAMVVAERAWHTRDGWALENAEIVGVRRMPKALWRTVLQPEHLKHHRTDASVWPLRDLARYVRLFPEKTGLRQRLYAGMASPLTGLILLALTVPLTLGHERLLRSRLLGIGASVVVCLLFYAVVFLAQHLGDHGQLPPALAALTPVALGAAAGLYLLDTMQT